MKKILAVDDTEIMLDIIQLQLEKEGYEVVACNDPNDALRRLSHERFDLVLLDIMMPGTNGLEVLKTIKKEEINKLTPVVMLTAKDDMSSVRDCLTNGALEYLTKPFNIVSVKKRIAQILDQSR